MLNMQAIAAVSGQQNCSNSMSKLARDQTWTVGLYLMRSTHWALLHFCTLIKEKFQIHIII